MIVPTPDPSPLPQGGEESPAEQPGFNLLEFLSGALVGVVSTLAAVFGIVGRLKNDKATLDAIEWLGKSIPIDAMDTWLDKLNEMGRNLRDAGEVIDKVTDGLPNLVQSAASRPTGVPKLPEEAG